MRSRAVVPMMLALATSLVSARAAISQQVNPPGAVFKFDKRTDGWKLLEDAPQMLSAAGFDPVSFFKAGDDYVEGDTMAARAIELGANLGQHDAEYLLENQLIPTELSTTVLAFPGTKWLDLDGRIRVPCLGHNGDGWVLFYYGLDLPHFSGASFRLARPRK
jgi:hypothetical protein